MGRLFEEFLRNELRHRIPMPKSWQGSLGLKLENFAQSAVDAGGTAEKLSGYLFQRDEPLQRGFIASKAVSMDFREREKYMMQVYLQAILEHLNEDYTKYFNYSSTFRLPDGKYETTIPVIEGEVYTVLGRSTYPAQWSYYIELTERVFASGEFGSLSAPRVIDTKEFSGQTRNYSAAQEYFMIKVVSYSPAMIVRGRVRNIALLNQFEELELARKERREQLLGTYPSIMNGGLYSDKLIPALLGMTITDHSPQGVKDSLLGTAKGNTIAESIRNATNSIYDRDGNMGGRFIW